jgi:branched-chain amino acid transport system permease protein
VLGAVIVLIVVALPKGIVGVLETIGTQRRAQSPKTETLTSETLTPESFTPRIETAE